MTKARTIGVYRGGRDPLILVRCDDMGPDDGNPYFVEREDYSASLACALDTGELTNNRHAETIQLSAKDMAWLEGEAEKLSDF